MIIFVVVAVVGFLLLLFCYLLIFFGQKAHSCSYYRLFIEYIRFHSFVKLVFHGKQYCKMLRAGQQKNFL